MERKKTVSAKSFKQFKSVAHLFQRFNCNLKQLSFRVLIFKLVDYSLKLLHQTKIMQAQRNGSCMIDNRLSCLSYTMDRSIKRFSADIRINLDLRKDDSSVWQNECEFTVTSKIS